MSSARNELPEPSKENYPSFSMIPKFRAVFAYLKVNPHIRRTSPWCKLNAWNIFKKKISGQLAVFIIIILYICRKHCRSMLSFVWILTLPVFMLIHTRASPSPQNSIPGEGSVNSSFELSFKDFQIVVYCKKSSLKLSFDALNKFLYSLWAFSGVENSARGLVLKIDSRNRESIIRYTLS